MAERYDYVKTRREDIKPLPRGAGEKKFIRGMKFYTRLNVLVYKLSGGMLMNTAMGGYAICLVSMTGRKSGKRIEIPLIHVPHGDQVILVGSQAGLDRNPAWVYSVRANPEVTIRSRGKKPAKYLARQVSDDEKRELWPHLTRIYPGYDEYQARTDRNIPVFLCDPHS